MTKKLKILGRYTSGHPGPFCTWSGAPAELKMKDGRGPYPLLGYIGDSVSPSSWTADGLHIEGKPGPDDLMNAEEAPVVEREGQKGAEEPVAWSYYLQGLLTFTSCEATSAKRASEGVSVTPLYTRPTNVAALESRIAELENSALDAIALIRNGRPVLARTALQRVTPGLEHEATARAALADEDTNRG